MKSEFRSDRYKKITLEWYYWDKDDEIEKVDPYYNPDLNGYAPVVEAWNKIGYVKVTRYPLPY
jgi:hypothetical protein